MTIVASDDHHPPSLTTEKSWLQKWDGDENRMISQRDLLSLFRKEKVSSRQPFPINQTANFSY